MTFARSELFMHNLAVFCRDLSKSVQGWTYDFDMDERISPRYGPFFRVKEGEIPDLHQEDPGVLFIRMDRRVVRSATWPDAFIGEIALELKYISTMENGESDWLYTVCVRIPNQNFYKLVYAAREENSALRAYNRIEKKISELLDGKGETDVDSEA